MAALLAALPRASADEPPPGPAAPIIVPGDGFDGPQPPPQPVGDPGSPGFDATVIAHWDVVPFQTFGGDLEIGVVAFHRNGIDRVEFSAEGGPWTAVTDMTLNPRTGVVEYWAVLRAADLPDGPVKVRAIAYPKFAGVPRLVSFNFTFNGGGDMPFLLLWANAAGSLPGQVRYVSAAQGNDANDGLTAVTPYQDIEHAAEQIEAAQGGNASGGTIYLLPQDDWVMPSLNGILADRRWLTIAAAPGVAAHDVVFSTVDDKGLSDGLLRVANLTVRGPDSEFGGQGGALWFDRVTSLGTSAELDGGGFAAATWSKAYGLYATDSFFSHLTQPMVKTTLIRNVRLHDIGVDLFREPRAVINVTSTHHGYGPFESHGDFVQWYLPDTPLAENFIFYNVSSYGGHQDVQGIYHDGAGGDAPVFNNVAFVNVHIDRLIESSARSLWLNTTTNHMLLWQITHHRIAFNLDTPHIQNFSMRGCCWHRFEVPPEHMLDGDIADNHYITADGYQVFAGGKQPTAGDPGWVSVEGGDFRPVAQSALVQRIEPLLATVDAMGAARPEPASTGAFETTLSPPDCGNADITGDDAVNIDDLILLITNWGECGECPADIVPLVGDYTVDVSDLLMMITNWGPCD
jgi:hypothetical protein